ncbi:DUF2726 domain-containing protein [Pasteurella multocida]|uniref:DUF2726 domain-containing protein n=1 Tax=Pasteurella multocida TaxID=747 RepID=UPI0024473DFC|nr:DUF2726 domain-containing protein [Pasteurella multocida]MDH3002029.1 adenylosuccinate synthetase [Pasteurella multocida]
MWQGIFSQLSALYPLIGLAIFVFIFKAIMIILTKKRKNKKRYAYSDFRPPSKLEILSNAEFKKSNLMNKSEYTLFTQLENLLNTQQNGKYFRLFSQVAMGEFIQANDSNAFHLINNKRVDFLIIDKDCQPIVVIEYQGSGHYQNNAVERDVIKKECCRKANIDYIEFAPNYDELDFQRVLKTVNALAHRFIKNEEIYAKPNSNQLAKSR